MVYNGNFTGDNNCKIYLGATTSKQAKLVYDNAVNFIKADPELEEHFNVKDYNSTIDCLITNNKVETIARISEGNNTLDGVQGIFCSVDEYHLHKNNLVYSLFKDGQKSLDECLLSVITTSGYTIDGACHRLYKYCKDIIREEEENEEFFVYTAELDEKDDLSNKENWYKPNPTLEYNPKKLKTMETSYRQAKKMGGKDWNTFLTKNLNMWVQFSENKYMNMDSWSLCGTDKTLEDFRNQEFILSCDLSSGGDLTSLNFEFNWHEEEEHKYFVHHHSFIPYRRIEEHEQSDHAPYAQWVADGLLTTTKAAQGIKTDYKEVLRYARKNIEEYGLKLKMICYDPHNASAFIADLEEFGVDIIDVYQNSRSLNDATMDIKYSAEARNVEYNKNDELLTWAINNCILTEPKNGNVMLDKNSRYDRIDPVAAWVCGHKFSMRNEINNTVELTEDYINNWFKKQS